MKTTSTPAWVHNQAQLAAILEVTRQTVGAWQRAPRAPRPLSNGKLSVARWVAFAREHSRDSAGTADEREEKRSLEARRLRAQCNKIEFELQVVQGEYTANATIREAAVRAGTTLNAAFQRLEVDLPGCCVGLSREQIQAKVREKNSDILQAFQAELEPLYQKA